MATASTVPGVTVWKFPADSAISMPKGASEDNEP
jgi:hypothetical protein